MLLDEIPDGGMYHLVYDCGDCKDASDNGNDLYEKLAPGCVITYLHLRQRVGAVLEHHCRHRWDHDFVYAYSVEKRLLDVACLSQIVPLEYT
jgi:hypothetical protein